MGRNPSSLVVDNTAIKLAFYQVQSGKESKVSTSIDDKCNHLKLLPLNKLYNSVLYYTFGSYDIVHIYSAADYNSILTQEGTIDGVTKVTRFYCYLLNHNSEDFFNHLKTHRALGITHLKLKTGDYSSLYSEYKRWANIKNTFVLGTLGWNELIILSAEANANTIVNKLTNSQRQANLQSEHSKKTFSLLGINSFCCNCNATESLHSDCNYLPDQQITDFEINVNVCSHSLVDNSALIDLSDSLWSLFGKYDYIAYLKKGITWRQFFTTLSEYRTNNNDYLIATHSHIRVNRDAIPSKPKSKINLVADIINADDIINIDEYNRLFIKYSDNRYKLLIELFGVDYDYTEIMSDRKLLAIKLNSVVNTSVSNNIYDSIINEAKKTTNPLTTYIMTQLRGYDKRDFYNAKDDIYLADPFFNRTLMELLFPKALKRKNNIFYYDYNCYEQLLDTYSAMKLTTHINSLNSLLRNNIISDSFKDMSNYLLYANRKLCYADNRCNSNYDIKRKKIQFAIKTANKIKSGAELRLNGTFGSIEDAIGDFSKLKGGVQQSVLAMEFVVAQILKRILNSTWEGFIIVSDTNLFCLEDEVIQVPLDSLWNPQNWMPLYHEIGHLIIKEDKAQFIDSTVLDTFYGHKSKKYWASALDQITADIIGYLIGFNGNYNIYRDIYLSSYTEISKYFKVSELRAFTLLRLFMVKLVDDLIKNKRCILSEPEALVFNEMKVFFEHAKCDITDFDLKHENYIAAEFLKPIKELLKYLLHVIEVCKRLNLIKSDCVRYIDIDTRKLNSLITTNAPASIDNLKAINASDNILEIIQDMVKAKDVSRIFVHNLADAINNEFKSRSSAYGKYEMLMKIPVKDLRHSSINSKIRKGTILSGDTVINYPEQVLFPFFNSGNNDLGLKSRIALIISFSNCYKMMLENGG